MLKIFVHVLHAKTTILFASTQSILLDMTHSRNVAVPGSNITVLGGVIRDL